MSLSVCQKQNSFIKEYSTSNEGIEIEFKCTDETLTI